MKLLWAKFCGMDNFLSYKVFYNRLEKKKQTVIIVKPIMSWKCYGLERVSTIIVVNLHLWTNVPYQITFIPYARGPSMENPR